MTMAGAVGLGKRLEGWGQKIGNQPAKVGFYGCDGELVKVAWVKGVSADKRPPKDCKDLCPGCGRVHRFRPFWRSPTSQDDLDSAKMVV